MLLYHKIKRYFAGSAYTPYREKCILKLRNFLRVFKYENKL